jgi:hypothetical protein
MSENCLEAETKSEKTKFVFINRNDILLEQILKWLVQNNIGTTSEKQTDISWNILRSLHENNINKKELQTIIMYINNNDFTLNEGNVWNCLMDYFKNEKYVSLFKSIFRSTPCGLSTSPNAACGKGELFYRLLRPNSVQPSRGDIIDNSIKKELKGNEVRISSDTITGKKYKNITDKLFKGHIEGNTPKTGGLKGNLCFEIEKFQYKNHYEKEFLKIPIDKRLELFIDLLTQLNIDGNVSNISNSIVEKGFDQRKYQRILLQDWFIKYKKDNFDELIILGNGEDIKIIKDISDLDKLEIYNDYFRINNKASLGWYVK